MKLLQSILIAGSLVTPLSALEPSAVSAVAAKFSDSSPDEQYKARIELNQLVDQATAPGKEDTSAVTAVLIQVLAAKGTPVEAKKYILRRLTIMGTDGAVKAMAGLLAGQHELLRNEARLVLESIHDPAALAVLQAALPKAADKRMKLGLVNSLAVQGEASSVPLIAPLVLDADPEIARAALTALARIGGEAPVATLKKANTSAKVDAALKPDVEKALVVAAANDGPTLLAVYQVTESDEVRIAAFISLVKGIPAARKAQMVEAALKSEDAGLRGVALALAVNANLPGLLDTLAGGFAQMPLNERMIVLAGVYKMKPSEAAGKIAIGALASEDEGERIMAIEALGKIGGPAAFEAVLAALNAREPGVRKAAGGALASMDFKSADDVLAKMLKTGSSDEKVLAIKGVGNRMVPGSNAMLLEIIESNEQPAAKEALRTIYFLATLDDLRAMCGLAKSGEIKGLNSTCSKIATRIGGDEAAALVKGLK